MDAFALVIAAALLVVGAAAVAVRELRRGASAIAVGLCLPALAYAGEIGASPYAAPASAAVAPLLAPVVAAGLVRRRGPVAATLVALTAGLVAGPLRTAVYDAYYDAACASVCPTNPLAVAHFSAHVHDFLWLAASVAAAALTVAAVRGPDRLALGVLAASAWLLAFSGAQVLLPSSLTGLVALVMTGIAVSLAFETRARMAELARALERASDIESTLATATRDPRLTVTYVLDDGSEVTADGSRAQPGEHDARTTDLVGPDGVVARVHHSRGEVDTVRLANAVRGPGRLALENGRLSVQVRREADRIEASRRRLVAHADAERRRLERDLHDSAQQHVLALGLALRASLDDTTDDHARDVLHRCLASTYEVLDELRELSHGFYPASLEASGLRNALDGVIDRATVPITVLAVPEGRLPAAAERAIYLLVARAAATARRPVTVVVRQDLRGVAVEIDGAPEPDAVLADVFAVLGGRLVVEPGDSGSEIRGVLPIQLEEDA